MIANINDIDRELQDYPSRYVYNGTTIDGYNLLDEETHYNHGWREVVTPEFDPVTQYLGSNELVEDIITKPVLNYTTEEIDEAYLINRTNSIKSKYELHRANGWSAYQEFRAKVVSDIYDGLITEEQAFLIEENLSPAFDQISTTGDWKTARYKLSQIIPLPPYVEPYYDYAMQIINDYITNNYED